MIAGCPQARGRHPEDARGRTPLTLHWRAPTMADLDAVTRLTNASERHDRRPEITPREEWEQDFLAPAADLARDGVLAEIDGEPVAFGWCHVRTEPPRTHLFAFIRTYVVRDAREEIGDELLTRMTDIAVGRLAPVRTDAAKLVRASAMEHQTEDLDRFERLGYTPIRWFVSMSRALGDLLPERLDRSQGLELRGWREADTEPSRLVHNRAFADHWGGTTLSAHEWRAHTSGNAHFRADLSTAALDGDRMVGYLTAHHYPEDAAATGRHELWASTIGVLASHRGRGLASALLGRVLHQAADAGFASVGLYVDAVSPTGAQRLYERLGFRRLETSATYGLEVT
jgi:ribosomal protein S18 acetylase RimI-like enzyme